MVGHLKETPGFSDQMKGNRAVSVTKLSLINVYSSVYILIPYLTYKLTVTYCVILMTS
jgi:hypothetical protein